MSFSNPDGVQWVDLILSKSHILGPFRSLDINLHGQNSALPYLPPQTNICQTLSVYLEANQIRRMRGRCEDFSLVFAFGLKGAGW